MSTGIVSKNRKRKRGKPRKSWRDTLSEDLQNIEMTRDDCGESADDRSWGGTVSSSLGSYTLHTYEPKSICRLHNYVGYISTKNVSKMHHFESKILKNFLGRGQPLPKPNPQRRLRHLKTLALLVLHYCHYHSKIFDPPLPKTDP